LKVSVWALRGRRPCDCEGLEAERELVLTGRSLGVVACELADPVEPCCDHVPGARGQTPFNIQ